MALVGKHAFSDIYSMPKEWRDTADASLIAKYFAIGVLVIGLFFLSNDLGDLLRSMRQSYAGIPDFYIWYSPMKLFAWVQPLYVKFHLYPHAITAIAIREALILAATACVSAAVYRLVFERMASQSKPVFDTKGSARVATFEDIEKKTTFLVDKGSYLGAVRKPPSFPWEREIERYLRATEEGHDLVVAPTGSGKTTCYSYQLLTTWRGSIFCYDLKGEQWTKTSGYRKDFLNSTVLRLALADDLEGNAQLNPLDSIRIGEPSEYQDVVDLVEVLTDPEGKGHDGNTMSEGHFLTLSSSLLVATILYVLYTKNEDERNLSNVLAILSGKELALHNESADTTEGILRIIRDATHDPTGKYGWVDDFGKPTRSNKYITQPAMDILLLTEEARSSMIATCKRYLAPYRNPFVAKATAKSSFKIADLLDQSKNVSLYLVVPPSSKDSLKPVTRLIINQILKKLVQQLPERGQIDKRLRILLDEFDSLGKLTIFSDGLQFLRGYGMSASIIIQGYNQIYARYGQHEMITSACKNVIVYTPNDDDTAERISKRLGAFTFREKVPSAGKGQKATYRDESRSLLFPNEVRKMPRNRCLIFPEAGDPIYAYKRPSYEDPEFNYRTSLPPPFDIAPNHPTYRSDAKPIMPQLKDDDILRDVPRSVIDEVSGKVLSNA